MTKELSENQRAVLLAINALWRKKEMPTHEALAQSAGLANRQRAYQILQGLHRQGLITGTDGPRVTRTGTAKLREKKEAQAK